MKQKDVDRLLRTYMPEKQWVVRIGNEVYCMKCEAFLFKGAQRVKFRKISAWRWFGLRVGFGMWLERMGKRIADGSMKRGSDNGTDTQE